MGFMDWVRRQGSFGLSKALSLLGLGGMEGWTPYCDFIGMKMDCTLCPNHVEERTEKAIVSRCGVAYEKRWGKSK